jgi:tripartite-type tricarboxylate transporter receptor subunit TctC
MKLPHRRHLMHLAAGAAALPAVSRFAWAQAYPSRPVRIIVGVGAGGAPDIVARLMGQWLSERLGQPFIVENKPGAGTNIATEAVVRAPADGHTLLQATLTNAYNAALYPKLSFNFIRDIAPISSIMRTPLVMVANPVFPAKSVPEFIAFAKANPGKINMASSGAGNLTHLAGELFKMMADVDIIHVPYRATPLALTALLAGEVHVMFDPVGTSIEHIRAGKLRALAVTTAARAPMLPDIRPMAEFVPGYEASGWQGVGAPRNTPDEIIERLNQEINAGLADPTLKGRLASLGGVVFTNTPASFGTFISEETEKWGKAIKAANIKLE